MAEQFHTGTYCWATPKCGIRTCQTLFEDLTGDRVYRFIVVRNPYSRIVSFYTSKVVFLKGTPTGEARDEAPITNRTEISIPHFNKKDNISLTFSEFILALSHHEGKERHLAFQTKGIDGLHFHRTVRLETWADDIELVGQDLDMDEETIEVWKSSVINETPKNLDITEKVFDKKPEWFEVHGVPHWTHFYNDELKRIVYKKYKVDFEHFGYSFDI